MRWSLHRASLLTGVITIGGFLAIAAGSFYGLVGPYFARLDREKLLDHCGRVKEAIETELRELDRFAQDWGAWNDMYEYVVHPNEEFARENLIPVTYAELHINVLAIVGVSGQLVYTGAYDLVKNNRAEFPRRLAKILEEGKLSVRTEYPGRRARGLVALPEGLLMVAVRPILKSTEEGPVRGSLVVGRWLDEEAISNIGARVRLLIAGWRVDREVERLPRGELEAYERLRANKKCGWASEADVGCGVGYLLISDIEGDPVVLVRVVPRRLIYREGKKVIAYCLGVMVVGGAGMWVVYMTLLRRLVVSRIQRLSRFARRVAMQGEGQTDETVWAADELGQLAADMNAMVARLREARDSERARRERLARFSAELVEMARLVGEYSEVRREILARTAAALEVTRVSFWRLGSGGRVIECEELCEVSGDGMSRESSLEVAAYPTYFEVLQGVQVIAADDAQHDVRTREFAETYLKPRGITSMMDAPVRLHGEMVGIVCCEHTGPGRVWSLEEQEFLAGVADLLALACETAERRRVEEKLRENEQRLLLAQEFGRIGTWDRDLRSKQEVWSGVTKEIFGVASEAREEGSLLEFVHPHDRGMVEEAIRNCLERGMVYNIEHRIVRPDGVVRWVAERGNVVRDEQGVPVRMLGLIMDITERKEAELALAAEKERLMVTLRSIGDGVITTDMKGRVTLMNKEAERLTGWKQEEVRGRVLGEVLRVYDEETREVVQELQGETYTDSDSWSGQNEGLLQARDGSERPIVWRRTTIRDQQSVVIGSVVVFHDVSMRRRAEHELLQAEKLRSIGILAGGIAHDFNNLLTVILGNISLARMQAEGDESLRTRLGEAEQAILEAMGLTKQLLTFSKGGAPVRKPLDVKAVVKTAVQFVCRGTAVRSKFVIGDEIWPVIGDSGQLSQVIHNLVINAIQAMNGKGEVEVGMENVLVDSVLTKALRPGRYVRIWVKDGGVGIPREHMTRIFDPYFSTKAQGSGLGLTVTYSIIKSHHGHIEVESELGKGSTFSIYLPAAEELPEVAREAGEVVKGVGRILLVDDEEEILATTGAMLRELGYEVETARDGQMAVRAYCEAKEKGIGYDVVILDLTVPGGTGGRETLEVLRRYDADVVAIASSGYSNDPVMAQYRSYGFTGVLMKPYTMHELSVAVREAIRSGQRRTGAT